MSDGHQRDRTREDLKTENIEHSDKGKVLRGHLLWRQLDIDAVDQPLKHAVKQEFGQRVAAVRGLAKGDEKRIRKEKEINHHQKQSARYNRSETERKYKREIILLE